MAKNIEKAMGGKKMERYVLSDEGVFDSDLALERRRVSTYVDGVE